MAKEGRIRIVDVRKESGQRWNAEVISCQNRKFGIQLRQFEVELDSPADCGAYLKALTKIRVKKNTP